MDIQLFRAHHIVSVLGFNHPIIHVSSATRDDAVCEIANPAFVVYSSIMSFYVPFIITLLVYVQIYVVLRKRRKRVNTKRSCQRMDAEPQLPLKVTHASGASRPHQDLFEQLLRLIILAAVANA